jgi:hypothetical protein
MPTFFVQVINSDFQASSQVEADDIADAQRQALKSALQIGADEVCKGVPFFGAEIRVELDGQVAERFLVTMGQSPLQ